MKAITDYEGIKYSLQPHGLRSKILYALAAFVVAFGGALAFALPAEAAPGDVTCFVETSPSVDPSASPTPTDTPTSVLSPTACPTVTQVVTVTVSGPTVTVTKTDTKTVHVTEKVTVTETVTSTPTAPIEGAAPTPSLTPTPVPVSKGSGDSSLVGWGVGTAGVAGAVLITVGAIGIIRSRRKNTGRHHVDNSETQMMPTIPGGSVRTIYPDDGYDISDYGPDADYDPALGGHAGETHQNEVDTEQIPPVEEKPDGS